MISFFILCIWKSNYLNEQRRTIGLLTAGTSTSKSGPDSKVMELFPVFAYSDVKNRKKIDTNERVFECAVCLSEYEDEDMLRLLPNCRHVFHSHCIDAWFVSQSQSTCPVCRSNVELMDPEAALHAGGSVLDVFEDDRYPSETINVTAEQTHVSISVAESSEQATGGVNLENETNSNQTTVNSTGRLQRSHSIGHSLLQQGLENIERYILGSPDDVRKNTVNGKLNRCRSCVTLSIEGSRSV
ncbi:hypothetical protein MKW94_013813 [Papaver nudicaule]|uniref:RING-type E3 ubiquitin transferase n=1 Tax=Papaver nudicaule TaxID=74823 RepID=A0AA41VUK6_PAPNU|nr:hypothetical protein [Papaver nudicaule]